MNAAQALILDSHVHLDMITSYHPEKRDWLIAHNCHVISWSFFENITTVSHLKACLKSKAQCIQTHIDGGLACRYLAGVHPRSIPEDLKPEHLPSLLMPYLEDPLCLGMGEIGLETGDEREQELFMAQLELGASAGVPGKVIGVHTPRTNKPAVTLKTLDLLKPFTNLNHSLVIDHCTPETIPWILKAGFWAGVTLSPMKTSLEEITAIVSAHADHLGRIMCNTDSGSVFFDDLVRFRHTSKLPETDLSRLTRKNAACFFGWPKL